MKKEITLPMFFAQILGGSPIDYGEKIEKKWFHSFKNGKIVWQGQVLSKESNNTFLVQLYSWIDGMPTNQHLVFLSEMKNWRFYNSDKEMKEVYDQKRKKV